MHSHDSPECRFRVLVVTLRGSARPDNPGRCHAATATATDAVQCLRTATAQIEDIPLCSQHYRVGLGRSSGLMQIIILEDRPSAETYF